MSSKFNDTAANTYGHLNTVAAQMATNAGAHTISFWFKKESGDTGTYSICSLATAAANNAALWAEHDGGANFRYRCRAGGTDSSIPTIANAGTSWTNVLFHVTTATGASAFSSTMYINGTAATTASSAGTAAAINRLTFAVAQFNFSTFSHTPNMFLSHIGVWSGHLGASDRTLLQTYIPELVNTGSLMWASQGVFSQTAGSVTDSGTVVGADFANVPGDNPSLLTSLTTNTGSTSTGGTAVISGRNMVGGNATIS